MKIEDFLSIYRNEGASAILRTSSQEKAARAMEAAIQGGFRIIEFTLTIPGAMELIQEFSRKADVIVGAGTVLTVADARTAVRSGATFLVSPVIDKAVIQEAAELGVASIPGAHTPTELYQAYLWGAPLQKLFPAPAGGPAYVRACLGPLPFLRIVPTNGVDGTNVKEYLKAGCFAVGFVKALFVPEDLQEEKYDRIQERARRLKQEVQRTLQNL